MVEKILSIIRQLFIATAETKNPQDMTGFILHEVDYNSQRDNFDFAGKFKGWAQCFSTCAYMLISYFTRFDGKNDTTLARYVDDVEVTVGKPGIGEIVKRKYNWITGKTSLWWLTQKYGIEKWLWAEGLKGNAVFVDKTEDWQGVLNALKVSPVILGTNKLGKLPGGHIILLTGFRKGEFIVNDPFGDARSGYKVHYGSNVVYSLELLMQHSDGKPRFMYWRPL